MVAPGSAAGTLLEAATLVDNLASQAALRRNGFILIGRAPGYLRIAGRWRELFQRLADTD